MAAAFAAIGAGVLSIIIGIIIVFIYDRIGHTDSADLPVYGTATGFIIIGALTILITLGLVLA